MAKKIAVITIPGIHWHVKGDWQNRMGSFLKSQDPDLKVFHVRYGRILGIMAWLMASNVLLWFSQKIMAGYVKVLMKQVRRIQKQFPDHEISILSHSFGTHISHQALIENNDFVVRNWILSGGVIPHHIQETEIWNWLEIGKLKGVHNWCSHKDRVVKYIAIRPFGKCGYWGFLRPGEDIDRGKPHRKPFSSIELYNLQTHEGHSGVYNKLPIYGSEIHSQIIA